MNITFLLLSVERSGGVRVTLEVVNQLAKLNHKCCIVVAENKEFPFPLNPNVKIINTSINKGKGRMNIISSVILLARSIPKNSDIIVASYYLTAYSALFAKLRIPKSKLFYIIQGYEPNFFRHKERKTQWGSYWLAKFSYYLPLKKSTISNWLSELLKKESNTKNIRIINNGIKSDFFIPINNKIDNNIIMTIGNSRPNRGFFDFCNSVNLLWKQRKDFKILVIGYDKDIIKLDMPYSFLTPNNDEELIEAYQSSTIFVSCSHEEGFGLTPLEAMSCGTSVVCTDSGGIRDYAQDQYNCLMVPVSDIQKITDSISSLLDDKILRDQLSVNGRKTALKFNWDFIGLQYESFFLQ